MKASFILALSSIAAILAFVGCTNPSITTTSYVATQVGSGTPPSMPDFTARTAIDPFSGDATGCFADGGPQPGDPPSDQGWYAYGTSPKVGQCNFPGFAGGTWFYDFYSAVCAGTGQTFDWQGYLTGSSVSHTVCTIPDYNAPAASSHFALAGSLPSTITVYTGGLTSTYGMPKLLAFNSALSQEATVTATSIAPGGTSATFPFPTLTGSGMHMLGVKNFGPSGSYGLPTMTYFNVGGVATLAGAFGVAAPTIIKDQNVCNPRTGVCTERTTTSVVPILTQYHYCPAKS